MSKSADKRKNLARRKALQAMSHEKSEKIPGKDSC